MRLGSCNEKGWGMEIGKRKEVFIDKEGKEKGSNREREIEESREGEDEKE